jgi:glycerol-3-phosphate responsive antiterminator
MPDSFIMNAFCTLDCITHASVKDPVYNEMLYKMSDRIVEKFVTAARKINAKSITQGILSFGEDFIMAVHKLDANIWYYSILKNQDNLDTLDSIVCDFSYDAVRILSGVVKRSIEEVVEEVN